MPTAEGGLLRRLGSAIAGLFRPARPTVIAHYLPAPQPVPQPAAPSPPRIEIVTIASRLDYAESFVGQKLTPDRVASIFRHADWGMPSQMIDMYEQVTLNDGHLRGLFEQRMDEVAAVPTTMLPGDDRAPSIQAATILDGALQRIDLMGVIEHLMLGVFYGFSYAEVAWQRRADGWEVPVDIVCVPHRRFMFDSTYFQPHLTSEANPWPGVPLERRPGSSWMRAETKRWRKQTQAGIFRTATWWAVFKRLSVRDWLIFAEKFGIPLIAGKYGRDSSETTRKALRDALEALGTEGRALFEDDATIEIFTQALRSGSGDHLHAAITQLCNSEISKIITAGTLTADTGGPGSFALGQVHADQKHKLSLADARRIGSVFCRDLGQELLVRNNLVEKASPPWLHAHVQKLSLLTDSQTLMNLVTAGLPISISQVQEKFEYRPPSSPEDTMKPPAPKGATNVDPANPDEPADPASA